VVKKTGIIERILDAAKVKQSSELKKTDGKKTSRITGIPKLEDANDAGTRGSAKCTLILTEGDSAKALAVSGLSVVGRDTFGVFPLRGKVFDNFGLC
jgi:DNA topoisomerase II